jgi:hypothetical protein
MPNSVQADFVMYDNTNSGLLATNAQTAIDEIRTVATSDAIKYAIALG